MPFVLFTRTGAGGELQLRKSATLLGRVRLSQGNRCLDGILILAFLLGIGNKYTFPFVNFRCIEPHKINQRESMYPKTESLAFA